MFPKFLRRLSDNIASPVYAGPAGKRLYAVGDIHGRLDLLDALLAQIGEDLRCRPVPVAAIVFLGDLIDRGPDSAGVIQRLLTLRERPARALFLLGNHEEMLLRVLRGEPGIAHDWLDYGGDACAQSYGVAPGLLRASDDARVAATLRAAIPAAHLAFLEGFGDTFRFGDFLLVHAGIRPGVPVEEQQPADLRWIRQPFLADAHDHGFIVVHGHTISDGVDQRPNRIGIDTGAYQTGILTAAAIEGAEVRFLATGRATAPAVAARSPAL